MIRRIPRANFNQFLDDYYHSPRGGVVHGVTLAKAFKATFEIGAFDPEIEANLEEDDLISYIEQNYVESQSVGLVH